MKKEITKKLLALTLAMGMAVSLVPTGIHAEEADAKIVNGDFETGDLTGWTLMDGSPAADNQVGVISSASTYWGARNFYKQGTWFLSGAEREGDAGTIRSSTFTLGGEGYIAFLIGSAAEEGKGCVRLYQVNDDGDDLLVKTYINKNWADPATGNTLLRIYDRLEDYIGSKLYFVIENGSTPGFSFINADDFRTSLTLAEVKALYAEDAGRIKGLSDEYADHIRGLYKNVVFYDTDTQVGLGEAVREAAVISSLKEEDTIAPGTVINLTDTINKAIKVEDGFGFAADYTLDITAVMYGSENLKDQADSLKLEEGTYEVTFTVSYVSEGNEKTDTLTYVIKAEALPVTKDVYNGDFETGDLSGWTLMDGNPAASNTVGVVSDEETYWGNGQKFYKQGTYFLRGDSFESTSGKIRSNPFILEGDGYISFMIGAAAKESKGCIRVYAVNDGEDTLVRTYTNGHWNDPKTGLTLIRVFDQLDSQYMGKELYFVIENGPDTAGFAFINADDFRTSLTADEVRALQEEQLDWLNTIQDPNSEFIISCYRENGIFNDIVLAEDIPDEIDSYAGLTVNLGELIASQTKVIESYSLRELTLDVTIDAVALNGEAVADDPAALTLQEGDYTVTYTRKYADVTEEKTLTIHALHLDETINTIENPGFETGDLSGWEVITPKVWNRNEDGSFAGVVSAETYWGERLPYNQEGNYHLDGWNVCDDEGASWGLRSSAFTLAGSGFISLRMGANAASVRVYSLDGTLLGTWYQNRFNDANFPFVNRGGSWADMGTYFIDLSDHIGEPMYIELHDAKIAGGWACAFFDDIRTYYETAPDIENGYDVVNGPVSEGLEYGEIQIPWTLLANNNEPVVLSFEDENYDVANTGGAKETAQLESSLKDPAFQDEPVLPYRPDGVSGKALMLDGYSNTASFNESISGSQLTVDAYVAPRAWQWDNPNSAREDQLAEVIVGSYDVGAKRGFLLGVTKHGYLAFRVGTGDNWYSITSDDGKRVPLYEWSRVTGVFNGDTGVMSVYLNGEPAGSKKIEKNSEIVAPGRPVLLGKGSESIIVVDTLDGTMFAGLVDEVSVRKTALSAKQVQETGYEIPELDYEDARVPAYVLENDWYRPAYHAAPPANWMNEPHALFQYKGTWHLFYQTNQGGPFWRNISWGHWVSKDLAKWRCVKDAVVPTPGTVAPDGIWTGNVIFTSDGMPMLLITAGDDARPVNGSNQHVGLVKAADYDDPDLTDWEILGYCVAQTAEMGTVGEFRDAQCFSIGEERYMVVGGADNGRGVAHTFRTTAGTLAEWEEAVKDNALNGMNWEYMGSLFGDYYDSHNYKDEYGKVWEMPNLAPLPDKDGNPTDKYLFVFSPQYGDNDVWYYIGTFDTETCRFTPDFEEARLMDYGNNIFTGPTVYVNDDGRVWLCSIMQENIAGEYTWHVEDRINAGWAFYAGLPRELYLREDGDLGIRTIDTANIEDQTVVSFENLGVEEANRLLAAVDSDQIRIDFTFTGNAKEVGFLLKKGAEGSTRFFVNETAMGLDQQSGPYTKGETVSGVIYVDKCSIEAYVDEYKTVSGSKFFRGTGLEVFIDGDATVSATVTTMNAHSNYTGFKTEDGTPYEFLTPDENLYWYENGERQGVYGDPKNIWDTQYDRLERGREIYDPVSDAWYWLDACYEGAVAKDKEVWIPYIFQGVEDPEGKWVRYDRYGEMVKGWYANDNGVYYYDKITGAMLKGTHEIDGKTYTFDLLTGIRQ